MKDAIKLTLDSGAYSFWSRHFKHAEKANMHLNLAMRRQTNDYAGYTTTAKFNTYLDAYVEYCHEEGNDFEFYVSLDVIGSAKHTYDIVRYMESCGLSPMPVFHYGEDTVWLKKYLDNYDHIGIGGVVTVPKKLFVPWADNCFRMINDKHGVPRVKVHGFAVTSLQLLLRYPWHTVDSTTWTAVARNGAIYVPAPAVGGGFSFLQRPTVMRVGDRVIHGKLGYERLGDTGKGIVQDYLKLLGMTLDEIRVDSIHKRDQANAAYMLFLCAEVMAHWKERIGWDGPQIHLAQNSSHGPTKVQEVEDFYEMLLGLGLTPHMLLTYFYQGAKTAYKQVAEDFNNE